MPSPWRSSTLWTTPQSPYSTLLPQVLGTAKPQVPAVQQVKQGLAHPDSVCRCLRELPDWKARLLERRDGAGKLTAYQRL